MNIELKNVSLKMHKLNILENISFDIKNATFTCLVGPNGSGKSTILKAILRELDDFEGDITDIRIKDICYIPQNLEDPSFLTVMEVGLLGFYANHKRSENNEILNDLMYTCGISTITDRKFTEISSGEKQRAWLVFALAQGKDVIIMDEPLSSVDQFSREQFYLLLRNVANMGKTLFIVTHDMDMALKFSDNLVVLNQGKVKFFGKTGEFKNEN